VASGPDGALVVLPELDPDVRARALARALEVRRLRASWKSRLAAGTAGLAELLAAADADPALAGMRVADALDALPGVGPRGVERILEACAIAPARRIRGLGARQRAALVAGAGR
jgi:hypothetical protein